MILPRHARFCIIVSMSKLFNLFSIIIFIFIVINHIISLKQPHVFIWTFLSKVQPQDVAQLFPIFLPISAWCCLCKCCVLKKACINSSVKSKLSDIFFFLCELKSCTFLSYLLSLRRLQ